MLSHPTIIDDRYPIVLVHGVLGWGRDELHGVKYWGGVHGDLQEILEQQGHRVFTAKVGKVASNWHRACELYAQIKGGRVDYGEAHSNLFGHKRHGKTYRGFYKEWGTQNDNGDIRKIHLIGHSMGGQTIRVLAQLLANGTKGAPTQENPNHSVLFEGGHSDWIQSISTIATPHQGSLLADKSDELGNTLKRIILSIVSSFPAEKVRTIQYDFDLEQWGEEAQKQDEDIYEYIHRVFESRLLQPGFRDCSLYDLTRNGARELNEWVKNHPEIYYFSYSAADTSPSTIIHNNQEHMIHVPNEETMDQAMHEFARFIGMHSTVDEAYCIDWQENDGQVCKVSAMGPCNATVVDYDGVLKPGVWQHSHISNMDHMAVIGGREGTDPTYIYVNHIELLHSIVYNAATTAP